MQNYQGKTTYGFGYKLASTRNKDDPVIDKAVGIADGGIKTDHIHWYFPHYTPSIQNKVFCLNKFQVGHLQISDIFNDQLL